MVAVPVLPLVGEIVTVRFELEPLNSIPDTGINLVSDEVAETARKSGEVSGS
jgi:hypothetical protein